MKTIHVVAAAMAAVVVGTANVARALPAVSNVSMVQRGNSWLVDISYTLSDEPAIVTLGIETNGVALSDSVVTQLSGDVGRLVTTGTHAIVWNAGADWPGHLETHARARVSAWVTNAPPPYCVVDLTGGSNASAYAVSYYASAASLPYGGLTNALYKSSYLVLRKIASGAFSMGDGVPSAAVTLTQDFYAGLFEVTQGQWCNVMGTALSAYSTGSVGRGYRPMEQVSYSDIRGASAQGGGDWPSNANVAADSFVGRLRARTGISGFDLPTEAQWEYACRAGTSTCFSDGIAAANVSGANADSNAWLDALGRYWYNGGNTYGTAIVGTYRPNAWGLYDVHGNVWEWCLDWYADPLTGGTDPKGAATGTWRVERGGGWESHASSCAAISRYGDVPSYRYRSVGFRLFRTLP